MIHRHSVGATQQCLFPHIQVYVSATNYFEQMIVLIRQYIQLAAYWLLLVPYGNR
jgi:hypothetical protein